MRARCEPHSGLVEILNAGLDKSLAADPGNCPNSRLRTSASQFECRCEDLEKWNQYMQEKMSNIYRKQEGAPSSDSRESNQMGSLSLIHI